MLFCFYKDKPHAFKFANYPVQLMLFVVVTKGKCSLQPLLGAELSCESLSLIPVLQYQIIILKKTFTGRWTEASSVKNNFTCTLCPSPV